MSIKNHPNLHVVNLMLKFDNAIIDCLRGKGINLNHEDRLKLAKNLAEKAEEIVDRIVK